MGNLTEEEVSKVQLCVQVSALQCEVREGEGETSRISTLGTISTCEGAEEKVTLLGWGEAEGDTAW